MSSDESTDGNIMRLAVPKFRPVQIALDDVRLIPLAGLIEAAGTVVDDEYLGGTGPLQLRQQWCNRRHWRLIQDDRYTQTERRFDAHEKTSTLMKRSWHCIRVEWTLRCGVQRSFYASQRHSRPCSSPAAASGIGLQANDTRYAAWLRPDRRPKRARRWPTRDRIPGRGFAALRRTYRGIG